jgi:hypothetical protein
MAATIFVERDVFKTSTDWISNKSDSINKPQSAFFEASATPTGPMMVTNGLLEAWGGALVSRKRTPLPENSAGQQLNWLAYRLKFRLPASTVDNLARHETDWKVCFKTRPNSQTKIRNVANFSVQWNGDTGQMQCDLDPPAWVDTGFIITRQQMTPDVWHTLEFRMKFDEKAMTFEIWSMQFDDQLFMLPDKFRGVPASNTNWEEVSSLQLQTEGYNEKSTVLVEYDEGMTCWSDERITRIPDLSTGVYTGVVRDECDDDEDDKKRWRRIGDFPRDWHRPPDGYDRDESDLSESNQEV